VRRRLHGLNQAARSSEFADGIYLVHVQRAQYHWDRKKPFYAIQFTVAEPKHLAGRSISTRIYCTKKALWKLSWFLHDFGYDSELLERDELEESSLVGLKGVIKISHTTVNGACLTNLDSYAPASPWQDLFSSRDRSEVA
jgi:hypothetical protein